jgi:hypothetical protein
MRAGLVVLLLLAACGSPDGADRRPVPLPVAPPTATAPLVGPAPRIPWWARGVLHVDGEVIPTRMRQVVARGGTTIVGRATLHGSGWMIVRDDVLVDLLSTHAPAVRPVLSSNGRYAAWATSRTTHRYDEFNAEEAFTVSSYDVRSGRVTGTTEMDAHTTCCDAGGVIAVAGVDNDGSVIIARSADRAWIWRRGTEPRALTGAVRQRDLTGNDQWPGGVSWTTGSSSSDPGAFGRASRAGTTTRLGRVPQSQDGQWSPDGTEYVHVPFSKLGHALPVVWTRHRRVRLRAPLAGDVVGWESPHSVIVLRGGGRDRPALRPAVLFRCDARIGACELAGPPIRGAHLAQAPAY